MNLGYLAHDKFGLPGQDSGSFIQRDFGHNLPKYLHPDCEVRDEVPMDTRLTTFRVDFLVGRAGTSIAIECDGHDYHQDDFRDLARDTLILMADRVNAIVRIRGSIIYSRVDVALHYIALQFPKFFSERGSENLRRLAADELKPSEFGIEPYFDGWPMSHQVEIRDKANTRIKLMTSAIQTMLVSDRPPRSFQELINQRRQECENLVSRYRKLRVK